MLADISHFSLPPETDAVEEDAPAAKRLRVDCSDGSAVIARLEELQTYLHNPSSKVTGNPSQDNGAVREDLLRSAVISTKQQLVKLSEEIRSLRYRLKQSQREVASLKAASLVTPQQQGDQSSANESTGRIALSSGRNDRREKRPSSSATSVGKSDVGGVDNDNTTGSGSGSGTSEGEEADLREQLAARVREVESLQQVLKSRQEAVEEAEKEVSKLQEEMERERQESTQRVADSRVREEQALSSLDAEMRRSALLENDVREKAELVEREQARFTATLGVMEQQVKEAEERMKAVEENCRQRVEEVETVMKNIQGERDGFERKLKRHKLFADVLAAMEHTIHKLEKVVNVQPATDASSREKILLQQVTDMSTSLTQLNSTVHKTKKLVAFGDKKNDQLQSEVLAQQKQADEQKAALEREQTANKALQTELAEARAEIARLRGANESLERAAQAMGEEMRGLKAEVVEMVNAEDSFQANWRRETVANEQLRERVGQLTGEVASLRKAVKHERVRFERRLLASQSEEDRMVVEGMQEAMHRYKAELLCPLCKRYPKNRYLSSCCHVLCQKCVEDRIAVSVVILELWKGERLF